jgi:hypothetical protein
MHSFVGSDRAVSVVISMGLVKARNRIAYSLNIELSKVSLGINEVSIHSALINLV